MTITGPHTPYRNGGLLCRPVRVVTWAYVGGVFGALGGRPPFLVSDGGAGNIG